LLKYRIPQVLENAAIPHFEIKITEIPQEKLSNTYCAHGVSNFKPLSSSPALLKSLEELQEEMNELTRGFVRIVIVLLVIVLVI